MDVQNSADFMNLRLLINKETEKIIYAEAGKDFVDLLFSFLTLPTGSIIKLLSASDRPKKLACITGLYNSVEKLQTVFMNTNKKHLLEPKIISPHSSHVLGIKSSPDPNLYYVCSSINFDDSLNSRIPKNKILSDDSLNSRIPKNKILSDDSPVYTVIHNMSNKKGSLCACGKSISYQVHIQNPSGSSGSGSSEGGYVKETVTFIITDGLEISPCSTITSINLLNKLNVKDLSELEERTARVGPTEALELLGASLVSTTALNDVFGQGKDYLTRKISIF